MQTIHFDANYPTIEDTAMVCVMDALDVIDAAKQKLVANGEEPAETFYNLFSNIGQPLTELHYLHIAELIVYESYGTSYDGFVRWLDRRLGY